MLRAKIIYGVVIAILIGILAAIYYYYIGGFDPIEVYKMEGEQRTVIGKEYTINSNYTSYNKIMAEAKAQLDSGLLKGELTSVVDLTFQDDDSIKVFVGASFEGFKDVLQIPASYSYREFEASTIYKVFVTQRASARPTPDKIAALVEEKTQQEQTASPTTSMEIYYEDGSLRVEFWVE